MAGELVVLADDYELLRSFLVRSLTRAGYRILLAQDAETVKSHLEKDSAREIRIVIADHNMPGLRGLPLARELEKERPDIRSIVVSGDDLTSEILPGDPILYLRKPFTVDELLVAMRAALA
jgi:two-component system cell cycle sensor histidine kinase/response regulator CckA